MGYAYLGTDPELLVPHGFVPAFEKANGPGYVNESVLEGETIDKWTQMITGTGLQAAASNSNVTAKMFAAGIGAGFKKVCADSFSSLTLFDGSIGGHQAFAAVFSCGMASGDSAGNAVAMGQLGHYYENGIGGIQDYVQAREWDQKGADAGDRTAMNNLGSMYLLGRGGPQDFTQAVKWLERAAAAGNATSMWNLGFMYEYGKGVQRDEVVARSWYTRAAALGYKPAQDSLNKLNAEPSRQQAQHDAQ